MPSRETRRRSQSQHKCFGFTEELDRQREKKALRDRPQPWVAQKLAIFIVVGLVGYAVYVYVVRFCVPMIRNEADSLGRRAMGIGFLGAFSVLFLMFCWAYIKVVLTPPGYARDYVAKTPPPVVQPQPYQPWNSEDSIAGTPYVPDTRTASRSLPSLEHHSSPSASPPHSRQHTREASLGVTRVPSSPRRGETARPLDAAPTLSSTLVATNTKPEIQHPGTAAQDPTSPALPPPLYSRRPPTHPALSPEYRYCSRDGLVKPMRAHHCRACGTCVLKYDHHCPWIGQCVGAFNHKFFVNFLQWSSVFTIFIFATLVARNVQTETNSSHAPVDPQQIVIIALSGVFTIFTLILFASHVHLILLNASTVEHLGMQRMHDRESAVVSRMTGRWFSCSGRESHPPEAYGLPDDGSSHLPCSTRRRILKQWDVEWGKIKTEGNIWWLGSKRANWEATMGKMKLGWILPVGRSIGDGLTYPINPRFARDGRWRRRAEWPEGLR